MELVEKYYQEYLIIAPDDFASWATYEIALRKLGKWQEADGANKMGKKAEAGVKKAQTEMPAAENQ